MQKLQYLSRRPAKQIQLSISGHRFQISWYRMVLMDDSPIRRRMRTSTKMTTTPTWASSIFSLSLASSFFYLCSLLHRVSCLTFKAAAMKLWLSLMPFINNPNRCCTTVNYTLGGVHCSRWDNLFALCEPGGNEKKDFRIEEWSVHRVSNIGRW